MRFSLKPTRKIRESSFNIKKESYDQTEISYLTKKISQMEQRREEEFTNKSGQGKFIQSCLDKNILKLTNCPLDLNQWVKNAVTKTKTLKPKISEFPIEMIYNPKFDQLDRYYDFDTKKEKVRTLKIIPVTVMIDERYSRNPVTMPLKFRTRRKLPRSR